MKKVFLLILITMILVLYIPAGIARAEFAEDNNDTFSIVWLSDTQDMSFHKYNGAMSKMGKWIAENRERLDIRYIVQTGDAVENGAAPKQWQEFDTMYYHFKDDIPYIGVAGNHEARRGHHVRGGEGSDAVRRTDCHVRETQPKPRASKLHSFKRTTASRIRLERHWKEPDVIAGNQ